MDTSLCDPEAITVPVPTVDVTGESRFKDWDPANITHFVVQMSDKRYEAVMQTVAGIPYDSNRPGPYWYFVGKMVSKAFFNDENRLDWLNATRVRTTEIFAFSHNAVSDQFQPADTNREVRMVEIDFLKPKPKANIKLFWKPARQPIAKIVQGWIDYESQKQSLLSTQ